MIATHTVKINGCWYYSGDRVPEEPENQEKIAEDIKEPEKRKRGRPRSEG